MKKLIITLLALSLTAFTQALAVSGLGKPVVVKQADGTQITIIITGDEWSRATLTVDGYQIVQRNGVYYYYEPQAATRATSELIKANDPAGRTPREKVALNSRNKGKIDGASVAPALRPNYGLNLGQPNGITRAVTPNPDRLKRVIVLLVQYSDVKFTRTRSEMQNWLNVGDRSARQYFIDNSLGKYVPQFELSSYITLSKQREYYGANSGSDNTDTRAREMVAEACRLADGAVNFRDFDCDADGVVDNVCVVFAGHNEAEGGGANAIWPHNWAISERLMLDGVQISTYSCTSELRRASGSLPSGIGTFVHEFSHGLGLSDFYDTNGKEEGESVGLYEISLMSHGNYNNDGLTPPYFSALERYLLNWIDLPLLEPNLSSVTLQPIQSAGQAYMIKGWGGWSKDEYYIVENRSALDWDAPLEMNGLLIYHIDRSSNNTGGGVTAARRWEENTINANRSHPCARLIESVGRNVSSDVSLNNISYPGIKGVTQFTGESYGGKDWRGTPVAVELVEIASTGGGAVSFATRSSQGSGKNITFEPMQRSIRVLFPAQKDVDNIVVSCRSTNSTIQNRAEISANAESYVIENLIPDTKYRISVFAIKDGQEALVASDDCMTIPLMSDFPLIGGLKSAYSVGEAFGAVGVINVKDSPQRVEFAVDGQVVADISNYKMPRIGSFVLTCTITYADNDRELITRKIKVQ